MAARIIISNDDGIDAPGLLILLEALVAENQFDIRVVAPAENQSAVGHGVTLRRPVFVEPRTLDVRGQKIEGHVVHGTPADCLILGYRALLPDFAPQLVISGINSGRNVSHSIFYSGTVAAALEGAILGIPAIALSLEEPDRKLTMGFPGVGNAWPYEMAAQVSLPLIHQALATPLSNLAVINVNIPNLPREQIKGVRLTHQGQSGFEDQFVEEPSVDHRRMFRLTGQFVHRADSIDEDAAALKDGWISVTPLGLTMYSEPLAAELSEWNIFTR